jgi:hypothetical protein
VPTIFFSSYERKELAVNLPQGETERINYFGSELEKSQAHLPTKSSISIYPGESFTNISKFALTLLSLKRSCAKKTKAEVSSFLDLLYFLVCLMSC